MAAEVIQLQGRKKLFKSPDLESPVQYNCGGCKGILFKLKTDGEVICQKCSAPITNLVIKEKT